MKKKWQRRTEIFIHSAKIFKSNIITNKLSLGEICNMCLLTVIIYDILPISEIHTLNVTIYDQCLLCQQNTRYIFMWIRWKEPHSYDNNHLIIRKQYNNTASTIEKIAVQNRRDIGRQHLTNFREAENIRKKSKESAKTSASFTANPFRFTKSLLEGEKPEANLTVAWKRHISNRHNATSNETTLWEDVPALTLSVNQRWRLQNQRGMK